MSRIVFLGLIALALAIPSAWADRATVNLYIPKGRIRMPILDHLKKIGLSLETKPPHTPPPGYDATRDYRLTATYTPEYLASGLPLVSAYLMAAHDIPQALMLQSPQKLGLGLTGHDCADDYRHQQRHRYVSEVDQLHLHQQVDKLLFSPDVAHVMGDADRQRLEAYQEIVELGVLHSSAWDIVAAVLSDLATDDAWKGLTWPRIATSYPGVAKQWARQYWIGSATIDLDGAVEVWPAAGLADIVVDVSSSGATLASKRTDSNRHRHEVCCRLGNEPHGVARGECDSLGTSDPGGQN